MVVRKNLDDFLEKQPLMRTFFKNEAERELRMLETKGECGSVNLRFHRIIIEHKIFIGLDTISSDLKALKEAL